jgi:3-oxoacyl-[acyl-carrier-protein] synthase-3
MRFENVSIVGVTHVDAPHRVTSQEIGRRLSPVMKRLGLGPDLIEALTGIVARRFWDDGVQPSQIAAMAGERALAETRTDRSRIGLVISTSVCKDYIEPSMACLVHGILGLSPDCMNFDVGNACLAFLNGMEIAAGMIERGQIDYSLIVDGESSRFPTETTIKRLLDPSADQQTFRDNLATLTLGSGGAAMILARSALAPHGHRLLGSVTMAASEHNRLCLGQPDCMITDASGLLVAGLDLAKKTWDKASRELNWQGNDLDEYVLHQVSAVHTAKLVKLLGISPEKVFKTFPEFGNIGPAALPITLSKSLEAGRIQKGHRIGLLGIGSGLNCSMMEVVW